MTYDEQKLACLYLLWPDHLLSEPPQPEMPSGYIYRSMLEGDDLALRHLMKTEGWDITAQAWQEYKDRILPKGLFLIFHAETNALVASAGAVHNPNPGRYYFPFGGELGYLIVDPSHRGKRLGHLVSALVVQRFISAGYENIRVCVQGFRVAAIKTYLRLGFVPFLHDKDVGLRWKRICEQTAWPYAPDRWPHSLER